MWDYPRPPVVKPCHRGVRVEWAGEVLADSTDALRVLETSHPPTIYIPPSDVRLSLLTASDTRPTSCEFKGEARYLDAIVTGHRAHAVAWSYPAPAPPTGHRAPAPRHQQPSSCSDPRPSWCLVLISFVVEPTSMSATVVGTTTRRSLHHFYRHDLLQRESRWPRPRIQIRPAPQTLSLPYRPGRAWAAPARGEVPLYPSSVRQRADLGRIAVSQRGHRPPARERSVELRPTSARAIRDTPT